MALTENGRRELLNFLCGHNPGNDISYDAAIDRIEEIFFADQRRRWKEYAVQGGIVSAPEARRMEGLE